MSQKWIHPNQPHKYFKLIGSPMGGGLVQEYRNDQYATKLMLDSMQYNDFLNKLERGGWHAA